MHVQQIFKTELIVPRPGFKTRTLTIHNNALPLIYPYDIEPETNRSLVDIMKLASDLVKLPVHSSDDNQKLTNFC